MRQIAVVEGGDIPYKPEALDDPKIYTDNYAARNRLSAARAEGAKEAAKETKEKAKAAP